MKDGRRKRNDGLWLVAHSHRHGTSTYVAQCRRMPTEAEAIEAFRIDYEPDEGESIDIAPADVKEIRMERKGSPR